MLLTVEQLALVDEAFGRAAGSCRLKETTTASTTTMSPASHDPDHPATPAPASEVEVSDSGAEESGTPSLPASSKKNKKKRDKAKAKKRAATEGDQGASSSPVPASASASASVSAPKSSSANIPSGSSADVKADTVLELVRAQIAARFGPGMASQVTRENAANLLSKLDSKQASGSSQEDLIKEIEEHKFWKTQPVTKSLAVQEEGPIQPAQPISEISKTPLPLPADFEWVQVDIDDAHDLTELHELMYANYAEDEEESLRFRYSAEFLHWYVLPSRWARSLCLPFATFFFLFRFSSFDRLK